ncbi:hypothetical protein BDN72DRAFT_872333 [Pluteus cervinus]|uniref:Uncharacterized protein n=1 Tax=Pluteus cervinus TaxID=181527 RepID=A0ACD3AC78_9AGAR|nr:hypothetical protein BDN72DRAFT_872333 [Pluteus cervinus]
MIFAGDFAQLPPPIGQEAGALYSLTSALDPTDRKQQASAIGKALWHQITTVVLLRKIMRQTGQSQDEIDFRLALANLRYKACTKEDLKHIRKRVHSKLPGLITAWNIHKDVMNDIGTRRFAEETGQNLHVFYSNDILDANADIRTANNRKKRCHFSSIPPDDIQNQLWNIPPGCNTRNMPGKLVICLGLPVMIRTNIATELCMTKGQEGTITGWTYTLGNKNQRVLDTVFVKLTDPPQTVQFSNLPENVVPVIRTTATISCLLSNDKNIAVSRTQVEIIANFAMTDFASQGKTRPTNVVHLNYCKSHQAVYTALSRGKSYAKTLIIQGFEKKHFQGGCSGGVGTS